MSPLSIGRHVALLKAQTCLSTPKFESGAASLLRENRGIGIPACGSLLFLPTDSHSATTDQETRRSHYFSLSKSPRSCSKISVFGRASTSGRSAAVFEKVFAFGRSAVEIGDSTLPSTAALASLSPFSFFPSAFPFRIFRVFRG